MLLLNTRAAGPLGWVSGTAPVGLRARPSGSPGPHHLPSPGRAPAEKPGLLPLRYEKGQGTDARKMGPIPAQRIPHPIWLSQQCSRPPWPQNRIAGNLHTRWNFSAQAGWVAVRTEGQRAAVRASGSSCLVSPAPTLLLAHVLERPTCLRLAQHSAVWKALTKSSTASTVIRGSEVLFGL